MKLKLENNENIVNLSRKKKGYPDFFLTEYFFVIQKACNFLRWKSTVQIPPEEAIEVQKDDQRESQCK